LSGNGDLRGTAGRPGGYPTRWPADPADWLSPADAAASWIADEAGTVLGHIMVRRTGPDAAEIAGCSCRRRLRGVAWPRRCRPGRGSGPPSRGITLTLQVTTGQHAAITLYERTGWRRTGTVHGWTTPAGEDYLHQYTS
jgi:hypothetical protein